MIVTSHQAFLTEEAPENIAETIVGFTETNQCPNELCFRCDSAEDCKDGKCF